MYRRLGRLLPFRLLVVVLAALLGFTCLALFLSPTDSVREHLSLSRALSTLTSVQWVRYGQQQRKQERNPSGLHVFGDILASQNNSSIDDRFLAALPHDFQEQLTAGLLLECHSGPEGLLRSKYDRFLRILLDYASHHNVVRDSRTLTWQCSVNDYCGGLGDRIRGVVYALLLAIFSRRRLVVYWDTPSEGQYLHPHMLDWTDKKISQFLRESEYRILSNYSATLNEAPLTPSGHMNTYL
jgi:hypothetical protein